MSFFGVFLAGLVPILTMMIVLWIISISITNVSIVDIFWGFGFAVTAITYYSLSDGNPTRMLLVLALVALWGLRLSVYLGIRNAGKGEDFRYRNFRNSYGESRYWWVSFFQTFLLQGTLMWLISLPVLAAMYYGSDKPVGVIDMLAMVFWLVGFVFEAGGDLQLAAFKRNPENKGRVLDKGFWKYTRHPNYFGDAMVWWSFALFSIAAGGYWQIAGSAIITFFLMRVSGVTMLERTLLETKPKYRDYVNRTSSFFPLPPKK